MILNTLSVGLGTACFGRGLLNIELELPGSNEGSSLGNGLGDDHSSLSDLGSSEFV
jgi:hypothetical protein